MKSEPVLCDLYCSQTVSVLLLLTPLYLPPRLVGVSGTKIESVCGAVLLKSPSPQLGYLT